MPEAKWREVCIWVGVMDFISSCWHLLPHPSSDYEEKTTGLEITGLEMNSDSTTYQLCDLERSLDLSEHRVLMITIKETLSPPITIMHIKRESAGHIIGRQSVKHKTSVFTTYVFCQRVK